LKSHGIFKGKKVTSHPSVDKQLKEAGNAIFLQNLKIKVENINGRRHKYMFCKFLEYVLKVLKYTGLPETLYLHKNGVERVHLCAKKQHTRHVTSVRLKSRKECWMKNTQFVT